MRFVRRALVFVLALVLLAPQVAFAQEGSWWQTIRIVDGDTLWVAGLGSAIRLAGINAPEPGQRCAAEATELVRQLAFPRVFLEFASPQRDQYGRYRAYVRYLDRDGQLWTIQERLLQAGYATADSGRFRDPRYGNWFAAAEAEAIAAGRGIWGGQCSGRGGIIDPFATSSPPPPPPPPVEPGIVPPLAPFTCPASHPIKLNANSGIYHVPGGAFYNATNPEACARTEADARAAGYRRSLR
ncbi:MAG: thermonuclease family protein [Chloroflexota bacterium]|nr:thermonuclease family protein [Dehalococcoidia bacterium]MDW8252601.1 thermonuclease family protein [Chloroflexota bacterium]